MAIITSAAQIPGATDEELRLAYVHYAGRASEGFTSRAVGEQLLKMALLSSADARGHLGVPKGSRPNAAGHADLVQLAADTRRDDPHAMAREGLPGSQAGLKPCPAANPYPPGTLAARLWAQAEGDPPPLAGDDATAAARRAASRADRAPIVSAGATGWVRATGSPSARLQPSSVRAAVCAHICASSNGAASVASLLVEFGPAARGCIAKLRSTNHITDCPAPGAAATPEGTAP